MLISSPAKSDCNEKLAIHSFINHQMTSFRNLGTELHKAYEFKLFKSFVVIAMCSKTFKCHKNYIGLLFGQPFYFH